MAFRPHLLGIDDGPFDKRSGRSVPIVGVMMEGADLVEAVALTEFPLDGDGVTEFLAQWVAGLRCAAGLQGVVLGGISIAGLAIVDIVALAERLALPVLVANRHEPGDERLAEALTSAGLAARIPLLARTPPAWRAEEGLFVTHAGTDADAARALVRAARHKSNLPEPLRLAHLIGAALVNGQSRGRP